MSAAQHRAGADGADVAHACRGSARALAGHDSVGSRLTFEEKVDVFYEQTLGWQLHIADLVANGGTTFGEFKLGTPGYDVLSIRHSGFAVLHMCLSYIEMIGSLVDRTARG